MPGLPLDLTAPTRAKNATGWDLDSSIETLICSPWTLFACKLTIGLVSAVDVFLTLKYVNSLPQYELNPIGRWLMSLDSSTECQLSQISCFITAKFAGNFLTLSIIELLCHWKRHVASAVAAAIACFQLMLLYFLLCG